MRSVSLETPFKTRRSAPVEVRHFFFFVICLLLFTLNFCLSPFTLSHLGATEMSLAAHLTRKAKTVEGVEQWPFGAVGIAMEVRLPISIIPITPVSFPLSLLSHFSPFLAH